MTSVFDSNHLEPPKILRLKSGEDEAIEAEAAAWLAKSREGVTALSEKRDWLSFDQLLLRSRREISNSNGIADESLISGLFRRSYNPNMGNRPRNAKYEG